ncbi:Hemin transport system permease protein HmuU [subsurface metagenome]
MNTLLLAGVTVNILSSGIILFMRYLVTPNLLVSIDRWLMGGIDVIGYNGLISFLPFFIPAAAVLLPLSRELNALVLGEEMALGYGVDVKSVHLRAFAGGGLLTAAVVSLAGPIGFVGLVVPHIVRRISGYDHRIVLPASFLAGGAFLVLCDTLARTIISPTEMPVGVITAIIGAPVFIRLLFKSPLLK